MRKQWILGALTAVTCLAMTAPVRAQNNNNERLGQVLGGLAGALLGSKVGQGNGKVAATAAGAIIGVIAGGSMGRGMDEADRRAYTEADQRAYVNAQRDCFDQGPDSSIQWRGQNARGTFTTTRQGYNRRTREVCNEYSSSMNINGNTKNSHGIACRSSDGSYYEATQSEVIYDGGGYYDSYQGRGDSYEYSRYDERERSYSRGYDHRDRDRGYDQDRYQNRNHNPYRNSGYR